MEICQRCNIRTSIIYCVTCKLFYCLKCDKEIHENLNDCIHQRKNQILSIINLKNVLKDLNPSIIDYVPKYSYSNNKYGKIKKNKNDFFSNFNDDQLATSLSCNNSMNNINIKYDPKTDNTIYKYKSFFDNKNNEDEKSPIDNFEYNLFKFTTPRSNKRHTKSSNNLNTKSIHDFNTEVNYLLTIIDQQDTIIKSLSLKIKNLEQQINERNLYKISNQTKDEEFYNKKLDEMKNIFQEEKKKIISYYENEIQKNYEAYNASKEKYLKIIQEREDQLQEIINSNKIEKSELINIITQLQNDKENINKDYILLSEINQKLNDDKENMNKQINNYEIKLQKADNDKKEIENNLNKVLFNSTNKKHRNKNIQNESNRKNKLRNNKRNGTDKYNNPKNNYSRNQSSNKIKNVNNNTMSKKMNNKNKKSKSLSKYKI